MRSSLFSGYTTKGPCATLNEVGTALSESYQLSVADEEVAELPRVTWVQQISVICPLVEDVLAGLEWGPIGGA